MLEELNWKGNLIIGIMVLNTVVFVPFGVTSMVLKFWQNIPTVALFSVYLVTFIISLKLSNLHEKFVIELYEQNKTARDISRKE